jgi:hypothetical protein
MKSDLNHCFASQSRLNYPRSNKKFDETDDDEAEFWDAHGNRVRAPTLLSRSAEASGRVRAPTV